MRPISKNCLMMSGRKCAASSISRTYGLICSRANLRTVAWKNFSSSLSRVSGGGTASMVWGGAAIDTVYSRERPTFTRLVGWQSCYRPAGIQEGGLVKDLSPACVGYLYVACVSRPVDVMGT